MLPFNHHSNTVSSAPAETTERYIVFPSAMQTAESMICFDDNGIVAFHSPPSNAERKFISLVKILGFYVSALPTIELQVRAMVPIIEYFRTGMNYSFTKTNGDQISCSSTVAHNTIRWIHSSPRNQLSRPCIEEIESIVLDQSSVQGNDAVPANVDSISFSDLPTNFSISAEGPANESLKSCFSERLSQPMQFAPSGESYRAHKRHRWAEKSQMSIDELPREIGHFPEIKDLWEELERTQKEVGHNPVNDVHRGKGQGVKNLNSRFYTPLIAERALEYSKANESSKGRTDKAKHAIAIEILIRLAMLGGRIRDADNQTPLSNRMAAKKVMNALKDKAREMRKKGILTASDDEAERGAIICQERRTQENVELIKLIRRSSETLPEFN